MPKVTLDGAALYRNEQQQLEKVVIPVAWDATTQGYETPTSTDGAANVYVPDSVQSVAHKGTATGGTLTTLVDSAINMVADCWKDKLIRVFHASKKYIRKLTASVGSTFTYVALEPAVAASAVIGEAPGGIATIVCKTLGVAGNAFTVEVVAGTGTSSALAVALADGVLTITSATDGAEAPVAIAAGDLEALFAAEATVNAAFDVDNLFTAGAIALTSAPIAFAGGDDGEMAVAGDKYEVLM